jgi:hypothetical protein
MPRVKQQNTLSSVLDPRVAAVDAVAGLLPEADPGSAVGGGIGLGELGRRTLSLVVRLEAAPYAGRLAELSATRWPEGRLGELKRLGQAAVALDEPDPTAEPGARAAVVGEATALRDGLVQTARANFAYSHPIHAELKGVGRAGAAWVAKDLERLHTSLGDRKPEWVGKVGAADAAALDRIPGLVDTLRAEASDDWAVTRRKVRAVLIRRFTEARLFGRAVVADGTEAPVLPTMGTPRKKKKPAAATGAKPEAKGAKPESAKAEAPTTGAPASAPAASSPAASSTEAPASPAPAVGDGG